MASKQCRPAARFAGLTGGGWLEPYLLNDGGALALAGIPRFMLGTPLLTSEFRRDRIDYVYYMNPRRGPVQIRRLTLKFKDNRLEGFETDPMPSEEEADVLILGPDIKRVARTSRQPAIPMPDVSTPAPGSSQN